MRVRHDKGRAQNEKDEEVEEPGNRYQRRADDILLALTVRILVVRDEALAGRFKVVHGDLQYS
jgi:hypothetical protein